MTRLLNMVLRPCLTAAAILAAAAPERSAAAISESDSGNVQITGIPMIEQDGQGFCAPAAVAMLMKYHGVDIGQSLVAGIGNSSRASGTDMRRLFANINAESEMLGCRIIPILDFDMNRYRKTVERYNRIASRTTAGRLTLPDATQAAPDAGEIFSSADIRILRKCVSWTDLIKFRKEIRKSILDGRPLIWGVVLGVKYEPGLGTGVRGGHIRLITGFNPRTDEVIYADPWGPGHESKKMDTRDAAAITLSLHSMQGLASDPGQPPGKNRTNRQKKRP